jgi:hypothetical protein
MHCRNQRHVPQCVYRPIGQEDQADAGLPDDHRPQRDRYLAHAGKHSVHNHEQGDRTGELEERRRRNHCQRVSDEIARAILPSGFEALKPYLRTTKPPG